MPGDRDATAPPSDSAPEISVIIPVRDGAASLWQCLAALSGSAGVSWECIVVDDGSADASAAVARAFGARLASTGSRALGPAAARNLGARLARAPLLCFLDADVVPRADTLARFVALFDQDPTLDAAFGSYDRDPAAPGLVSQYRNLLHHYVHQRGRPEASTFWAGCGAIRRQRFLALGGFDTRYRRPSIEDIELGYRLRAAGGRIRLAADIQVTHLKRWTLWSVLRTDIRDRALPWTELIVRSRHLPNDLNLDVASRASAASAHLFLLFLALGWRRRRLLPLAWLPLLTLALCNRGLYVFLLRERGPWFLARALPLHWLYYLASSLAFAAGNLWYRRARARRA